MDATDGGTKVTFPGPGRSLGSERPRKERSLAAGCPDHQEDDNEAHLAHRQRPGPAFGRPDFGAGNAGRSDPGAPHRTGTLSAACPDAGHGTNHAPDRADHAGTRATPRRADAADRRNRSEEHTSELQSLMRNSYAVFCLKKKTTKYQNTNTWR